jgi:hypothetical protein
VVVHDQHPRRRHVTHCPSLHPGRHQCVP